MNATYPKGPLLWYRSKVYEFVSEIPMRGCCWLFFFSSYLTVPESAIIVWLWNCIICFEGLCIAAIYFSCKVQIPGVTLCYVTLPC